MKKKIEIYEDGKLADKFYLDESDVDYLAELIGELPSFDYCEEDKPKDRRTPYERTRDYVYSTGNKWAIENFNATHN